MNCVNQGVPMLLVHMGWKLQQGIQLLETQPGGMVVGRIGASMNLLWWQRWVEIDLSVLRRSSSASILLRRLG